MRKVPIPVGCEFHVALGFMNFHVLPWGAIHPSPKNTPEQNLLQKNLPPFRGKIREDTYFWKISGSTCSTTSFPPFFGWWKFSVTSRLQVVSIVWLRWIPVMTNGPHSCRLFGDGLDVFSWFFRGIKWDTFSWMCLVMFYKKTMVNHQ